MKSYIKSALFCTLTVFLLGTLAAETEYPFLFAPFGATCLIVFAFPKNPFGKPKNLFGGYVIATLIGLIFQALTSGAPIFVALAVGLGVFAMLVTSTVHPPAAGMPILIFFVRPDWEMMIVSVLGGVGIIFGISWAKNRWIAD